jgi:hypothetical protein
VANLKGTKKRGLEFWQACTMTIPTVSNQGFTDKKHISGIFTLSHPRGAPHTDPSQLGYLWDAVM